MRCVAPGRSGAVLRGSAVGSSRRRTQHAVHLFSGSKCCVRSSSSIHLAGAVKMRMRLGVGLGVLSYSGEIKDQTAAGRVQGHLALQLAAYADTHLCAAVARTKRHDRRVQVRSRTIGCTTTRRRARRSHPTLSAALPRSRRCGTRYIEQRRTRQRIGCCQDG